MLTHEPVLLDVVEEIFLETWPKKTVVDATLGLGWHTRMMLSHLTDTATLHCIDRDGANLEIARQLIEQGQFASQVQFHHGSFEDIGVFVQEARPDFILYDLWVSSAHYDDAVRGFSVRMNGPLDMRFDRTKGITAEDFIYSSTEQELREVFYHYADEKKTPFIARAIVEKRKVDRIDTTEKLLQIIEEASFDPKSAIRVFQALRIAINDEFGHIERSLERAIDILAPGGIIAVITFHSIEDRLVKQIFAPYMEGEIDEFTGQTVVEPILKKYTKKPIEPTPEEIQSNPRSRSAKLRIVQKR